MTKTMIYVVGRIPTADIVISNETISELHAQLLVDENGHIYINDLNSKNGTFVNGVKVSSITRVFSNDQIVFGKTSFDWEGFLLQKTKTSNSEFNIANKSNKKTAQSVFFKSLIGSTLLIAVIGLSIYFFNETFSNQWASFQNQENEESKINLDERDAYNPKEEPKMDIKYDLSCLKDENDFNTVDIINWGSEIQDEFIRVTGPAVKPKDELELGEQVISEFKLEPGIKSNQRLNTVFNKMLTHLGTTPYDYEVFELRSNDINAFTIGGKIFVATGMLNFTENDDELAAIIGHEIYHNELGHIKKKLQLSNLASEILGKEIGSLATQLHSFFSAPFNQKDEAYSDLYGVDLAIKAGYNACSSVNLWERMSKKESGFNVGENILRSHPYSSKRMNCLHHHLNQNYKRQCR